MKKKFVVVAVVIVVLAAGLVVRKKLRQERWQPVVRAEIDDPAQLDDLHQDLSKIEPAVWVRSYLPSEAESGLNLGLYRRRIPMIFDMNGRVVHVWPKARSVGRVRLNRAGRLAVIGTDNLVKEYDWDGNLTWYYQLPDEHHFPHHDVITMQNGHYLILGHDGHTHTDYLHEVDREGRVVWEWWMDDHREHFSGWDSDSNDPSHSNSIRELPANRWQNLGDARFRPGNILVSARNLNTIFIIDKLSGEVVWQYSADLDHQHEAAMVVEGRFGEGLITVFNNGLKDLYGYRRSRIQAIDPTTKTVAWEYASEYFFSPIGGTAQSLPGENILITSSHGGRVFEITPQGRIVWEWVPPFKPMRVERLSYDHCPQLEELVRPVESAIKPQEERPYVDIDLYSYAIPEHHVTRKVAGRNRKTVPDGNSCRELLIPPDATMRAPFGIDESVPQDGWSQARFRMTLEFDGRRETLIDQTIESGDEKLWLVRKVPLEQYAYERVELCISTEVDGKTKDSELSAVWGNPNIEATTMRPPSLGTKHRMTEQERKLREQQLKALGYVN